MCGTCGCGSEDGGVKILKVKGENQHEHVHDHVHEHSHDHTHDHIHPHSHNHQHSHTHTHEGKTLLEVEQDVLHHNELHAAQNRGYFEAKGIMALNLVSSPGSGKTAILERTLEHLKDDIPIYVIEGDQQTLNDANRIAKTGTPVIQINTGKGCHLESDMIYRAVQELNIKNDALLMIENVGNLVCPSMFNLGEHHRVVIISPTEGEDKPLKYPDMFYSSDVCLINKIDLLPYLDVNLEELKQNILKVNPDMQIMELSATKGTGMETWYDWLQENHQKLS